MWLTLAVIVLIIFVPPSTLGVTWGSATRALSEVFYIPCIIAFFWPMLPCAAVVVITAISLVRMKDGEKETEKCRKMSSLLKIASFALAACSIALFIKVFYIATLID